VSRSCFPFPARPHGDLPELFGFGSTSSCREPAGVVLAALCRWPARRHGHRTVRLFLPDLDRHHRRVLPLRSITAGSRTAPSARLASRGGDDPGRPLRARPRTPAPRRVHQAAGRLDLPHRERSLLFSARGCDGAQRNERSAASSPTASLTISTSGGSRHRVCQIGSLFAGHLPLGITMVAGLVRGLTPRGQCPFAFSCHAIILAAGVLKAPGPAPARSETASAARPSSGRRSHSCGAVSRCGSSRSTSSEDTLAFVRPTASVAGIAFTFILRLSRNGGFRSVAGPRGRQIAFRRYLSGRGLGPCDRAARHLRLTHGHLRPVHQFPRRRPLTCTASPTKRSSSSTSLRAAGLTPQYEAWSGAGAIRRAGFSVLAVPCNQFGEQEPGSPMRSGPSARRRTESPFP